MSTPRRIQVGVFSLFLALSGISSGVTAADTTSEDQGIKANDSTVYSENLLNRIRISSKHKAAEAAYYLSLAAVDRNDLNMAFVLIEEATGLSPQQAEYQQMATQIAFKLRHFKVAESHLMRQLELVQGKVGHGDPVIADLLENLGVIQMNSNQYEDAKHAFIQSLLIRQQNLGNNHPKLAVNLNFLAGVAEKQHQPDVAEAHLQQALSILKAAYGDSSPQVASELNSLGGFHFIHQRYTDAEKAFLEAIHIAEQEPAKNVVTLATSLNGMGKLALAQNRLDDAKTYFEYMYTQLVSEFGEQHPFVAEARRGLAQVERSRARAEIINSRYC